MGVVLVFRLTELGNYEVGEVLVFRLTELGGTMKWVKFLFLD